MNYFAAENKYDNMIYKNAGHSGLKLPGISLGLWHNFGKTNSFDNMQAMTRTAFDNGVTHFDMANNYGPDPGCAEESFGRLMDKDLRPYRDELVISTKAGCEMWNGPYGQYCSRKHLIASLDQSLKRMRMDYVDIFYMHTPDAGGTPVEESMLTLDQIVRSGKALYIGLSNHNKEEAEKASAILKELKTPFIVHQNSYSILNRRIEENGLLAFAKENGQGMVAFKTLEQGVLTDRYLKGIPADSRIRRDGRYLHEDSLSEERLRKVLALNEIAMERGESLAQMATAWVYQNPAVATVLIGASKPEQILDNVKMLHSAPFSKEELERIESIKK